MKDELLKKEYWSKSKFFLLPLTGIKKTKDFKVKSYIRWDDYSINEYNLIVKFIYGHKFDQFEEYMRENLSTSNKSKAFVTEIYDYEGFSVLIFDISEWASDINKFIKGRYSKI